MKFQFVKSILACSVFALGSVALTACGGDSSSSADEGDSSSSAEPLVLSSVSETSPLDAGSKVVAAATADGQGSYYLSLSGIIKTDSEMFPDPEGYDGEDPVYYNIDSLQFDVGDKDGNRVSLPVNLKQGASLGKESINLISVIDEIPLDQDATCGDKFTLYVTIFMSGDTEDTKQYAYTARLTGDFSIPCKVIESSSAAAVCTELVQSDPIILSNKIVGSQDAINFATGTGDSPDVTMKIEDRVPFFEASAGVKIIQEGSQESGVIPTGAICLENFTEAYNGEANPMELDILGWYLVKTATETYPVMIQKFMAQDESKGDLTFIYFKKK